MKIDRKYKDTVILETEDLRELFRSGSFGLGLPYDVEVIKLDSGISLPIIKQALDDVEREQREKDQAQQNSDSSSAVSG